VGTRAAPGMYSGAPLEAHFGLGAHERIELLEVAWPDGGVSAFRDAQGRQRLTVIQPDL
jgi:hypothetical protein